jgi:hypothetical protein
LQFFLHVVCLVVCSIDPHLKQVSILGCLASHLVHLLIVA